MLLSIIIVLYNSEEFIYGCLNSIYDSLSSRLDLEVILIDNNSKDKTIQKLKKFKSRIVLIKNKSNLGFAKACNQGIKTAQGKYLFFLNPDTIVKKNAIEILVSFLQKNSNVGVVGPLLIRPNGNVVPWQMGYEKTLARAILEEIVEKIIYYFKPNWFVKVASYIDLNYADPYKVCAADWVNGAAIMIRKKILDEWGGFDERFFLYYEELDLQKRIKKLGWKIYHNSYSVIIHFGKKSNLPYSSRNSYLNKSKKLFFEKHSPF